MIDLLRNAWDSLTAPGAPFAMSETTVRGVPIRVFTSAPPHMRAIWEATATPDRASFDYIVYEDERHTYADIHAQVRSLAHLLADEHDVQRGDRVALAMRNYPEWIVGYWATVSLGAAVVGMNAWWTGNEMEYGLADSRPKVLIVDDERLERVTPHLDTLRQTAPLHVISVRTDRSLPGDASRWADVVDASTAPAELPPADIDPDDDACIFYTSGTTGFPKGAQLTHRGSVHNVIHLVFWASAVGAVKAAVAAGGDVDVSAAAIPSPNPDAPQSVYMASTPLFHVTACNCLLHPATLIGGRIVLTYKWDPGRALELIERERVTNFSGVPTMSRELLNHPDWAKRDTSSLSGLGGGGAPLQPDLVTKIAESVPSGGPATGYGMTETHGIITANGGAFFTSRPTSVGPVMPTLDAKLIDETGADIAPGPHAVGELCVRGSVVIKGYLHRDDATTDSIRDGWLATGDIARIDEDGFVYIVDRAKDMVLRGGENVYCAEVEAVIYEHGDVAEAAVFGIPDDRLGEDVAAAVVPADGASITADELRSFMADKIAKHKIPSTIWFLDEPLPRNANGKFVKRQLRDELVGSTTE